MLFNRRQESMKLYKFVIILFVLFGCTEEDKTFTASVKNKIPYKQDFVPSHLIKINEEMILIGNDFEPHLVLGKIENNEFSISQRFGKKGPGPEEFSYFDYGSVSFDGDTLYAVDGFKGNTIKMYHFEDDEFKFVKTKKHFRTYEHFKFAGHSLESYFLTLDDVKLKNVDTGDTIRKKIKFSTDHDINELSNHITIRYNNDYLFLFYNYFGKLTILDKSLKTVKEIDLCKTYKTEKELGVFLRNDMFERVYLFSKMLILDDSHLLFYKYYEEDKGTLCLYNWKSETAEGETHVDGRIAGMIKFGNDILTISEDCFVVYDIN